MTDENGKTPAPTPAETDTPEVVPASERLMGLFGLAVAIGIALIAIDLITGGAVSRLLPVRDTSDDG